MKTMICICALFALAACASGEPLVTTVPVVMPMVETCKVARPERPMFPLESLTRDATLFAQVRAALGEIKARKAYEIELEAAVGACR